MFTEEHGMLRKSVRAFVEKEVAPHVDDWEATGQICAKGRPSGLDGP